MHLTSGRINYIFNHTKHPFNDGRVRKAFSMAFNRKELVEKVTKGGEIPAFAYVPPMAGYEPPKGFKEGIEEAKNLLAAAGYPGGKGFPKVTILYNTSESHKKIAEISSRGGSGPRCESRDRQSGVEDLPRHPAGRENGRL